MHRSLSRLASRAARVNLFNASSTLTERTAATSLAARSAVAYKHHNALNSTARLYSSTAVETDSTTPVSDSTDAVIEATAKGPVQHHEFKTETRKLLNLVANSLYSEKEVFVRELVSNAADALEKLRHLRAVDAGNFDAARELEVHINVDPTKQTFSIQDHGIGMTEEELNANLGTIASSGSKTFLEKLETENESSSTREKIIGQFGVGFYSAFMVGNQISVYTRSAKNGSKGYIWTSDGLGAYDIQEAENVDIGTKIVVHLKNDCLKFAEHKSVEDVVKKYSNFVGFPIHLNGKLVNTVQALWATESTITEDEHKEFYKFVSHDWAAPRYTLRYKTDAPIQIQALLYVPERHSEALGMERMEPGVSLYSRKVLIQAKAKGLLPDWLRFVKGVIDSEDIPLNISRELLQDGIVQRLRGIITSRVLKFLNDQARREPEKYAEFFNGFGSFLKEGLCTDPSHKKELAHLLRFESSNVDQGHVTSLKDYLARRKPGQTCVFYHCVPNRTLALDSPYFEAFKAKGAEVLFMYDPMDEFVTSHLEDFEGGNLVAVDSAEAAQELAKIEGGENEKEKAQDSKETLSSDVADMLALWMQSNLKGVKSVKVSTRLVSSPAIVTDFETAAVRRMMQMMSRGDKSIDLPRAPVVMEINPCHPVIRAIEKAREERPEVAKIVTEQLLDNTLVAAGVMDDPRSMLNRLNKLLELSLTGTLPKEPSVASKDTTGIDELSASS